jgi:Nucleoside-diphosphate-sugar epimerases
MKVGQSSCDHDLILVTGGAGFIGSNIVLELAKAGARVAVCDLLRSGEKWRNLSAARLHDVIHPDALFEWLARHRDKVAAVVHMGAISSTTEKMSTGSLQPIFVSPWTSGGGAPIIL